jgi:LCCL domain
MKVVQELVTYFDRRGKLSRRQLRKILDQNQVAADAPTSMHGLCDITGAVHYFRITGVTEGQVWGTGTYTLDSRLGAAAVHAGLLKPGQTAVLRMTVVPPLKSYPGTTRNGVTTTDYGNFPHCWQLSAI